jgi:hypothetical protein
MPIFPSLTAGSATVATMHAYSRILGSIRAAREEFHPRWWHAALTVTPEGLDTGEFPLTRGTGRLLLDPRAGTIRGHGTAGPIAVAFGPPASAVGRTVLEQLGDGVDVDPDRWDALEVGAYDPEDAATYHQALLAVQGAFASAREGLDGEVGPIHLWPHHFDLSFEWFSPAVTEYDEEDGPKEYNHQIGFGFSPGDEGDPAPYFYANPWPWQEAFSAIELPGDASWHIEGWTGGFLPYAAVAGAGSDLVGAFIEAVYAETHEALGGPK